MRLGILLPTRWLLMKDTEQKQFETIIDMATTAEDLGLDSVWVGDSLTAKPRLEPLSVLSAVATKTNRIRLGTAVMLGALRHPLLLAQTAATIDFISDGRLTLGMGVGGAFNQSQKQEWQNAGVNPNTRASRFEELVHLVKRLTRGEIVTYEGNHFSMNQVSVTPKSPNADGVHIILACHWRAAKEQQFVRAAKLGDGYISISDYPHEYEQVIDRVRIHAKSLNRDFDAMERVFYMTINIGNDPDSASLEADRFLKLYYGMNMWGDRWGPYGPPELITERIRSYQKAGAQTIIIRFAAFDQAKQLNVFSNKILPEF